jgi:hypothetical protein
MHKELAETDCRIVVGGPRLSDRGVKTALTIVDGNDPQPGRSQSQLLRGFA